MRIRLLVLLAATACSSQAPTLSPTPSQVALQQDGRIAVMLGEIDPRRIRSYDSALVSFGTRNSYSDTISGTRGIGAARRWIHSRLTAFSADCGGCLRVEFDTATVQTPRNPASPQHRITNVIAWLPGRDASRVIVIGGHYDSCVCAVPPHRGLDSVSTAPGANDDGSGSSAVIELARVFSRMFSKGLDATVIFALYDAEEQGLLGSSHLARRLKDGGYKVVAGMTDDIVGNVTAEDGTVDSTSVRIFAPDPDTSRSRELARHVWAIGDLYLPNFRVVPVWRLDRVGRGGDHRPFVELGWAGLRFTERIENEKRQHRPADELAWVNFGYIANVARLNGATIASLALAPATPDSARAARDVAVTGGRRWTLSWTRVPGATSYEILLRPTTSARYERVIAAGTDTSHVLDVQLDDVWAGIRAVGADGQRSLPIVVPRIAPRRTQATEP
jgi:peptidase M28-like protein